MNLEEIRKSAPLTVYVHLLQSFRNIMRKNHLSPPQYNSDANDILTAIKVLEDTFPEIKKQFE